MSEILLLAMKFQGKVATIESMISNQSIPSAIRASHFNAFNSNKLHVSRCSEYRFRGIAKGKTVERTVAVTSGFIIGRTGDSSRPDFAIIPSTLVQNLRLHSVLLVVATLKSPCLHLLLANDEPNR
jgi:hypothetical protein